MEFRYFSCVEGSAVRRFGTDAHIGAKVVPGEGYVFDPEAVVAIPASECRRYVREYNNVLRRNGRTGRPALIERTEKDYNKYIEAQGEGSAAGGAETIVPGEPAKENKPPKGRSKGRRRAVSSGGKD